MEWNTLGSALIGGALIGIAVSAMLLFNGRVTGISGILASALAKPEKGEFWRWSFLAGMVAAGVVVQTVRPDLFLNRSGRGLPAIVVAGLLVGYGTVMGSGCTSGHGICGISRLSVRSLIATATFMLFGFLVVQAVNLFAGGAA